ncbi:unnamed protein product [Zymoseptoria tritici ST99CH_1A5]|uniref:Copper transport protein n=1 Tax=Zymoseptoria tritici ST99CH_1A5 TaxID=1276529 RepID=A0A1Y6L8H2_ZYMTR|nr:unnamed protein product [Zymoseptoria tritici ST99CH_1A5]
MDHGGMDMGDSPSCKISMLWNWYTVDACFLTSSWHVTSNGMFAASCIGVAFLVVLLEALRRLGQDYDALIHANFRRRAAQLQASYTSLPPSDPQDCCGPAAANAPPSYPAQTFLTFRPSPLQQTIRAVIHMLTFGVAYIVMLLAMYFNGYIILSIFLGAGLGKFLCDWRVVKIPLVVVGGQEDDAGKGGVGNENLTFCCD